MRACELAWHVLAATILISSSLQHARSFARAEPESLGVKNSMAIGTTVLYAQFSAKILFVFSMAIELFFDQRLRSLGRARDVENELDF